MGKYSGSRNPINFAKRIVVKVGTSTLTYDNGKMNLGNIDRLCRSISDLMNRGKEVLLVSSGAIGVGIGYLDLKERPTTTREKQAIASVGQCELMNAYARAFPSILTAAARSSSQRTASQTSSQELTLQTPSRLCSRCV